MVRFKTKENTKITRLRKSLYKLMKEYQANEFKLKKRYVPLVDIPMNSSFPKELKAAIRRQRQEMKSRGLI